MKSVPVLVCLFLTSEEAYLKGGQKPGSATKDCAKKKGILREPKIPPSLWLLQDRDLKTIYGSLSEATF
jgi:hypothetical protein